MAGIYVRDKITVKHELQSRRRNEPDLEHFMVRMNRYMKRAPQDTM